MIPGSPRTLLRSPAVKLRLLLTAVLLASCAHAPAPGGEAAGPAGDPARASPAPAGLQPEVDRATRLGRAIFAQDEVSARGADVLVAKVPAERRVAVRGWLTIEGPWWKVAIVVGEPGTERIAFEASLPRDEPPETSVPSFQAFDPPRPLDADEKTQWRARRTAIRNAVGCGWPMNPVVLPASLEGRDGWLVYLLSATTKPGETVVGGHMKLWISPGGDRVLQSSRLSQCLLQPPPLPGAQPVGLFLVTPQYDVPNEGHVFTAMTNGQPLSVGAWKTVRGRMWLVAPDGTITREPDVRTPPGAAAR